MGGIYVHCLVVDLLERVDWP